MGVSSSESTHPVPPRSKPSSSRRLPSMRQLGTVAPKTAARKRKERSPEQDVRIRLDSPEDGHWEGGTWVKHEVANDSDEDVRMSGEEDKDDSEQQRPATELTWQCCHHHAQVAEAASGAVPQTSRELTPSLPSWLWHSTRSVQSAWRKTRHQVLHLFTSGKRKARKSTSGKTSSSNLSSTVP